MWWRIPLSCGRVNCFFTLHRFQPARYVDDARAAHRSTNCLLQPPFSPSASPASPDTHCSAQIFTKHYCKLVYIHTHTDTMHEHTILNIPEDDYVTEQISLGTCDNTGVLPMSAENSVFISTARTCMCLYLYMRTYVIAIHMVEGVTG